MIDESNLKAIKIQDLALKFLNQIKDDELKMMISCNVKQTMYAIHECYNYQYRQFLKNENIDVDSEPYDIFDLIDEDMFVEYMHNRFGIEVKEIKYFEFVK